MTVVRAITEYSTSRDYELLFELMQKSSIICIVDFKDVGMLLRRFAVMVITRSVLEGSGTYGQTLERNF
jgi:hypothetical protein